MRKDQVIDGEHENKMQVSFAIEEFCKMGFDTLECSLAGSIRMLRFVVVYVTVQKRGW